MLIASVIAWPFWALGVVVAMVFYLGLGYLAFAGLRLGLMVGRRALRELRLSQRARDLDGQAYPTLLDVALARARQPEHRQPTRRAA